MVLRLFRVYFTFFLFRYIPITKIQKKHPYLPPMDYIFKKWSTKRSLIKEKKTILTQKEGGNYHEKEYIRIFDNIYGVVQR